MLNLSYRQLQILRYLHENYGEPVSSDYFAKTMGFSKKTIKNDINNLNSDLSKYGAMINSKTGVGYQLFIIDAHLFKVSLLPFLNSDEASKSNSLPINFQRSHYIIRKLLASFTPVKVMELADQLYTSRTTISNDLKNVSQLLQIYRLSLVNRANQGLWILGDEHDIRLCLVDEYYYFENNDLFVNEVEYSQIFVHKQEKTEKLFATILEVQKKFAPIDISYHYVLRIMEMLWVSSYRNQYGYTIQYDTHTYETIRQTFSYTIACELILRAKSVLNHSLHNDDCILLAIYMACYRNYSSQETIKNPARYQVHLQRAEALIDFIVQRNNFTLLKSDENLKHELALHFIPMFYRIEYNVKLAHSAIYSIKEKTVTSYELAIHAYFFFKETMNIELNEDEIVFLAYVFFPTFGRQKRDWTKRNLIIMSSINKDVALIMAERFRRNFGSYLNQITAIEIYEQKDFDYKNYDLIITDIPNKYLAPAPIPIVKLDVFFKESQKYFLKYLFTLQQFQFKLMLDIFKEQLFTTNVDVANKHQFFNWLTTHLTQHLGLPNYFEDDLRTREEIMTLETPYNVAIGKCMNRYDCPSFVSISILASPIIWKYKPVQMVVIWHIGKTDIHNTEFMEAGYIGNILQNNFLEQQRIVKLLKYPTYDTMISMVKEMIDLDSIIITLPTAQE